MIKNLAKVFVNENGSIKSFEDTSFIVSGSDKENKIEIYVDDRLPSSLVQLSFKRADDFVISNRQMDFIALLDPASGADVEVLTRLYEYEFKEEDRILDIAGQLQVSAIIKNENKTVATPVFCLYVRRNIKPNLETTSEEEFYQEALAVVEKAQSDINNHKANKFNPHEVRADQVPMNKQDKTTVFDKINDLESTTNEEIADVLNESKQYTNNETLKVDSKINNHINNKANPHEVKATQVPIDSTNTKNTKQYIDDLSASVLEQAKQYTDKNKASQQVFVYDSLEQFTNGIVTEYLGDEEHGETNLVSITTENGEIVLANSLEIGASIKFRSLGENPDYFLSRKVVNYNATGFPLAFFTPVEGKTDLSGYVRNNDYATTETAGVIKVGSGLQVDENGILKVTATSSLPPLVFNSINSFNVSVDYSEQTNENGTYYALVGITNEENNRFYSVEELAIGVPVQIKDKNSPDYWLARKISTDISNGSISLSFFESVQGDYPIVEKVLTEGIESQIDFTQDDLNLLQNPNTKIAIKLSETDDINDALLMEFSGKTQITMMYSFLRPNLLELYNLSIIISELKGNLTITKLADETLIQEKIDENDTYIVNYNNIVGNEKIIDLLEKKKYDNILINESNSIYRYNNYSLYSSSNSETISYYSIPSIQFHNLRIVDYYITITRKIDTNVLRVEKTAILGTFSNSYFLNSGSDLKIKTATDEDIAAGTDDYKAVTSKGLKKALENIPTTSIITDLGDFNDFETALGTMINKETGLYKMNLTISENQLLTPTIIAHNYISQGVVVGTIMSVPNMTESYNGFFSYQINVFDDIVNLISLPSTAGDAVASTLNAFLNNYELQITIGNEDNQQAGSVSVDLSPLFQTTIASRSISNVLIPTAISGREIALNGDFSSNSKYRMYFETNLSIGNRYFVDFDTNNIQTSVISSHFSLIGTEKDGFGYFKYTKDSGEIEIYFVKFNDYTEIGAEIASTLLNMKITEL
ncbi:MAG: hypothetical protein [Podoviridae sp. ctcf755]|nr:MAG: hypothetical protein [Podoviridae sp. ctcf755]